MDERIRHNAKAADVLNANIDANKGLGKYQRGAMIDWGQFSVKWGGESARTRRGQDRGMTKNRFKLWCVEEYGWSKSDKRIKKKWKVE